MGNFHRRESAISRDQGCRLRPACLSCDLPRCYLDLPQEQGIMQRLMFDMRVMEAQIEVSKENPDMGIEELTRRVTEVTGASHRSVKKSMNRWESTWHPMNRPE